LVDGGVPARHSDRVPCKCSNAGPARRAICRDLGDRWRHVVGRDERFLWYRVPTLFEILESVPAVHAETREKLRCPGQWVCRPHASDVRVFACRMESGQAVGEKVQSGRTRRVKKQSIFGDEHVRHTERERSVMLPRRTRSMSAGESSWSAPTGLRRSCGESRPWSAGSANRRVPMTPSARGMIL